jgi:predicted nucleotidyltransferase
MKNEKVTQNTSLLDDMVSIIRAHVAVDAIYLYGSRARNQEHAASDWDLAVLFSDFEPDILERVFRPQQVEALLERELKMYTKISVVDLELVPPPLQMNIIRGKRLYDRLVPHVRRVEMSIISKIEKDYLHARHPL